MMKEKRLDRKGKGLKEGERQNRRRDVAAGMTEKKRPTSSMGKTRHATMPTTMTTTKTKLSLTTTTPQNIAGGNTSNVV